MDGEERRVANALRRHGTKAFQLMPGSIADAAIEDIRRNARNKIAGETGSRQYEQYAFLQAHVRKAVKRGGAKELIEIAIDLRQQGANSGKHITRLIYGDLKLLAGALLAIENKLAQRRHRTDAIGDGAEVD